MRGWVRRSDLEALAQWYRERAVEQFTPLAQEAKVMLLQTNLLMAEAVAREAEDPEERAELERVAERYREALREEGVEETLPLLAGIQRAVNVDAAEGGV